MRKIWGQTLFSSERIFFGSTVTCGRSEASASPRHPQSRHTLGRQPGVLLGGLPHQTPAVWVKRERRWGPR